MRALWLATCTLLFSLVYGWEDNYFNGISQVAIVVENLEEATQFYTDMGGMLVPKLSTDGIWGDSHYYRLFQSEILDVANSNGAKTLTSVGVPDISHRGAWKWRWNMMLFGNIMVQLMQFVHRNDPTVVWNMVHPDGNGAAKITLQHLALWGQESVDIPNLAQQLRAYAGPGGPFRKPLQINSVNNDVVTRQQQYDEPIESLLQLNGELLVTDGTQSERLELSRTKGTNRKTSPDREESDVPPTCKYSDPDIVIDNKWFLGYVMSRISDFLRTQTEVGAAKFVHLEMFCKNKSPAPMIMDQWRPDKSFMGVHHIGVVVKDPIEADIFYTNVLGSTEPIINITFPITPQTGPAEFQDDVLDAQESNIPTEDYGIPPYDGSVQQNILFYAFENTYLETNYFYTENGLLDYEWASLSPAYLRTIIAGFGVKDGLDLNKVVKKIEQDSLDKGIRGVYANRPIAVTSNYEYVPTWAYSIPLPVTAGDLQGYNYVLLRGPSEEPLFIVSYEGRSREALLEAMLLYDAKSGRFDETNPWKTDGFNSTFCCEAHGVCDGGSSKGFRASSPSTGMFFLTLILTVLVSLY